MKHSLAWAEQVKKKKIYEVENKQKMKYHAAWFFLELVLAVCQTNTVIQSSTDIYSINI